MLRDQIIDPSGCSGAAVLPDLAEQPGAASNRSFDVGSPRSMGCPSFPLGHEPNMERGPGEEHAQALRLTVSVRFYCFDRSSS